MPGLGTSLRRKVARRAERLLGRLGLVEGRPSPASPRAPVAVAEPAAAPGAAPAQAPEVRPSEPPAASAVAPAFTRAAVERVLDDLVRPALQSDGGDIELVDIVGGEVRVRLVGACGSCPSSVMTMKMGVERLLEDELPGFERLVQIEG